MLCRYCMKQTHQGCVSLPPQWVHTAECVLDAFCAWGTASIEDKDDTYKELHSRYLVFNYLAKVTNLPKDKCPPPHLCWSCCGTSHATSHATSWDCSWPPHPMSTGVWFWSVSPAPCCGCLPPMALFNNCTELADIIERLTHKAWNKCVEGQCYRTSHNNLMWWDQWDHLMIRNKEDLLITQRKYNYRSITWSLSYPQYNQNIPRL